MNPQCPICGNLLMLFPPPLWTPDITVWTTLLLVRHVIKKHPEWVDLAD